jgi:hypothetical protein
MKPEVMNTLVIVIGGLGVLLIPTCFALAWASAGKLVTAINTLTITVAKIEVKLDNVTTKEIPLLREDMKAFNTRRRDIRGNSDKDKILED